jgi:hypothetical protein
MQLLRAFVSASIANKGCESAAALARYAAMETGSNWPIAISIGQLLIAGLVGGFGFYFAHQQSRTAQRKLRLDLFDRRFKILEACRVLFGAVIRNGRVTIEEHNVFALGTLDAEFLFDKAIADYMKEIRKHIGLLMTHHAMLESPERISAAEKKGEEMMWFSTQIDGLQERFRPFMKLDG